MEKNTGIIDRLIRVPLGIVIIAAGFYFEAFWGLVGVIPLMSGLSGFCPLYGVFGFTTLKGAKIKQSGKQSV